MNASKTFDLSGIVKAMTKVTEFIGGELSSWKSTPEGDPATLARQEKLLSRLEGIHFDLARIPELKAWASLDAAEINRILEREGFEIRVTQWANDGTTFGVLAILDVTVEWIKSGDGNCHIEIFPKNEDGKIKFGAIPTLYPAFELYRQENRVECLDVPGSEQPLVRIPTKGGDVACIHVMPDAKPSDFELYDTAQRISRDSVENPSKYQGIKDVTIPKVSLRQQVDISWMTGMCTIGVDRISQQEVGFDVQEAKQEVRFVMNEHGARAKTATALGLRSCSENLEHILIDDDFLFWIERPGVKTPVFVGYFAKDDSWSDPGSLDNV